MKVLNKITKYTLFPAYYFFHQNYIFGFFHKKIIKKFYYKNFSFDLNIKNLPISNYSSFLFKTYEYNDKKLIEKHINKKNKCIIIGGGLGFIATLAYHLTMKEVIIFEINKEIIDNLKNNLKINNCLFRLYDKNLTLTNKENTIDKFFVTNNFLSTSKYSETKSHITVENINKSEIPDFEEYNTLIIDGEGVEEYFIKNLDLLTHIDYIVFELHYNLFDKNDINKIFDNLSKFGFHQEDKCFNSFYFRRISKIN